MDLKSHMAKSELTGEAMAELIGGVTGAAVRLWMAGARMPSPEIAERIVEVTGGKVTVQDMHETRLEYTRATARFPERAA
jgi:DNA-binding transcriptional regulator YdaS (Cro superfamily)